MFINSQYYIIIVIIILGYIILKYYNEEQFTPIDDSVYFRIPYLFTLPTRNFPIYHDLRGMPNVIYARNALNMFSPCGYKFGTHIYDAQGNYFDKMDN